MAAWLGVSVRQYQRWEVGGSTPRGRECDRVRGALANRSADANIAAELTALHDEVQALRAEVASVRARLDAIRTRRAA
jgi:hypothetical protein